MSKIWNLIRSSTIRHGRVDFLVISLFFWGTKPFNQKWCPTWFWHLPENITRCFLKKVFLVLTLQSTCFICKTWKRKQTMEQQPHEWMWMNETKQKQKNKATSYSNEPCVLLFDSAYKQCNGITKGWLHCLTS